MERLAAATGDGARRCQEPYLPQQAGVASLQLIKKHPPANLWTGELALAAPHGENKQVPEVNIDARLPQDHDLLHLCCVFS